MALLLAVFIVVASGVTALYFFRGGTGQSTTTILPSGCVRPPGGFLIIASVTGYNGSIDHGVPANSWPIIQVQRGTTVRVTVCNVDHQAHGFQITHYFDSSIEALSPGQVLNVSFVADKSGAFTIKCSIFCTVHGFMLSGSLVVT